MSSTKLIEIINLLCGDTKKSGQIAMSEWTRPNVNYAKDWLNHSFLCPGLVWSQKEFHFGCDHQGAVNNHFPVYWGLFRHGDEQPTYQCSVRRQSFAKPCPGLSERLFRPIIAQSFARFISFTDDCTSKSSVNDRLISLIRHLYIIGQVWTRPSSITLRKMTMMSIVIIALCPLYSFLVVRKNIFTMMFI